MKLLSHGPEPCASANSAIPAYMNICEHFLNNRNFKQQYRRRVIRAKVAFISKSHMNYI